ncbi:hypothetical protein D3C86_714450 [compost metagenome]
MATSAMVAWTLGPSGAKVREPAIAGNPGSFGGTSAPGQPASASARAIKPTAARRVLAIPELFIAKPPLLISLRLDRSIPRQPPVYAGYGGGMIPPCLD